MSNFWVSLYPALAFLAAALEALLLALLLSGKLYDPAWHIFFILALMPMVFGSCIAGLMSEIRGTEKPESEKYEESK